MKSTIIKKTILSSVFISSLALPALSIIPINNVNLNNSKNTNNIVKEYRRPLLRKENLVFNEKIDNVQGPRLAHSIIENTKPTIWIAPSVDSQVSSQKWSAIMPATGSEIKNVNGWDLGDKDRWVVNKGSTSEQDNKFSITRLKRFKSESSIQAPEFELSENDWQKIVDHNKASTSNQTWKFSMRHKSRNDDSKPPIKDDPIAHKDDPTKEMRSDLSWFRKPRTPANNRKVTLHTKYRWEGKISGDVSWEWFNWHQKTVKWDINIFDFDLVGNFYNYERKQVENADRKTRVDLEQDDDNPKSVIATVDTSQNLMKVDVSRVKYTLLKDGQKVNSKEMDLTENNTLLKFRHKFEDLEKGDYQVVMEFGYMPQGNDVIDEKTIIQGSPIVTIN